MRNKPKSDYQAEILVVDDERENLHVLTHMLHRFGYRVRGVTDGAMAVSVARTNPPDLVMLDVVMPGIEAFEICRRLKVDPATRLTPVVLVTGLTAVNDRVAGIVKAEQSIVDVLSLAHSEPAIIS